MLSRACRTSDPLRSHSSCPFPSCFHADVKIHNIQLLRPLGFFIAVLLSDSFFNIVCKITTIMCRGFIRLYLNYQRYSYMNLQLFAFYSYLHIYFSLHSVLSFFLLLVAFIFSLPCTEPLTLLQHPNCHRGSKQFYFLPLTRWLLCQRLRFKTLPTALPVFALIQQQSFALLSSLCCEDVKLCQGWHCPYLATDSPIAYCTHCNKETQVSSLLCELSSLLFLLFSSLCSHKNSLKISL